MSAAFQRVEIMIFRFLNKAAMNNFHISMWKTRVLFTLLLTIWPVLLITSTLSDPHLLIAVSLIFGLVSIIHRNFIDTIDVHFSSVSGSLIEITIFYFYFFWFQGISLLILYKVIQTVYNLKVVW